MRILPILIGCFIWFSIFVSPAAAVDVLECPKGHLAFDMVRKTFVPSDQYSAHVYGVLDVPTPHTYELTFKGDEKGKPQACSEDKEYTAKDGEDYYLNYSFNLA